MKSKTLNILLISSLLLGLAACGGSETDSDEFDLEKLLVDVFNPQPGEKVLVMADLPHGSMKDSEAWTDRREMAESWRAAFEALGDEIGFSVYPTLTFKATGRPNGNLPVKGEMDGETVRLDDIMADTNIVVSLTEFSATAPLIAFTQKNPNLRVASMPGVTRSMEATALSADYGEVARLAGILAERLDRAVGAEVEFSTGDMVYFDLRDRHPEVDDGRLHADKEGMRVINLPSGETYMAPYEGEIEGQPSLTEGVIPMMCEGEIVTLTVEANRILEVNGDSACAGELRSYIFADPARQNIAELGLGVNDKAVVTGNVLEDEKVMGMHWAYGLSEHLGGTVGVDDFKNPKNAVHVDTVYPQGGPIEIASLVLHYEDRTSEEIIREGEYTISEFTLNDSTPVFHSRKDFSTEAVQFS